MQVVDLVFLLVIHTSVYWNMKALAQWVRPGFTLAGG